MTKYSNAFKIKVIGEYLAGVGSTSLHQKYHIPGRNAVLNWVHQYQVNGFDGFKNRDHRQEYTCNFKLKVLKWMKENHSTLEHTTLHFKMSSPSTIYQWDRRFEAMGVDGLKVKRGRPPMGKRKHPNHTVKKNNEPKSALQSDRERIKALELENELLQIENEYLKKLDALVRQREQRERNKRK
ncbi:MAG: helix-turn-helix domain-containing protein [Sporolactobacillus sp.]|jgi:transposase-like protein|nr:helix-turn-helix domain-containing protein [Sporolactobacillus sp.]